MTRLADIEPLASLRRCATLCREGEHLFRWVGDAMDRQHFVELYDYNYWAQRRVWACVLQLSEEDFRRDLRYSVGSILDQCAHTLAVEHWWFVFLGTGKLAFLDGRQFTTREAIRAQWDATEALVRAYLDRLTPEESRREVRPDFWPAEQRPIKVYQALTQVANHSTDHRAQTFAGLHRLGAPTVGQDVLDYLFDLQESVAGVAV